jgi:hypothetical protein
VILVAVLSGAEFGEMEVRVGAGGVTMDTETAFDIGCGAPALLTVMLTLPSEVSEAAGNVANSRGVVPITYDVARGDPFICTTDRALKPVPRTLMPVSGEPTMIWLGLMPEITGFVAAAVMVRGTAVDVPPPGAGFVTEIASCAERF